ncbi:MAG TPA: response regulator [Stellaceae bacterium]|nr:response regulator [Stellaceae bacterium]
MPRILLVEDDPDVRPLLEHILQTEAGYSVTSAESLTIGLRLIAEQPFDLLITDVNLPDGSGLRLADKAKELGVPAVVLTGYGLSLKPGTLSAYDYLLKPVRPPELLKAIRERLSRDEGRGKLVPFPGQGQ